MMCAVSDLCRRQVVFCFMHTTPFHYYHYAGLLTFIEHIRGEILDVCVNACCVYLVENVPRFC